MMGTNAGVDEVTPNIVIIIQFEIIWRVTMGIFVLATTHWHLQGIFILAGGVIVKSKVDQSAICLICAFDLEIFPFQQNFLAT